MFHIYNRIYSKKLSPSSRFILERLSSRNIVSTVNLGCPLDLKRIALQARNAEYNPKRFAAVIMRIRNPRTTALIFGSGKMVCTGAKSEEDSLQAARRYALVIQKLGFPVRDRFVILSLSSLNENDSRPNFEILKYKTMVGSVDVKFPIRLEALVLKHYQFCRSENKHIYINRLVCTKHLNFSYEPELFPEFDLSDDATQDRPTYICVWQSCLNRYRFLRFIDMFIVLYSSRSKSSARNSRCLRPNLSHS